MSRELLASLAKEHARIKIEAVRGFVQRTARFYEDAINDLERLFNSIEEIGPEEADGFADDRYIEDEIVELSGHLAIVALYRVVELGTKQLLRWRYGNDARRLYSIDRLQTVLANDFGTDITTVDRYHAMNETRLLNNAVKHDGRVSNYLKTEVGDLIAMM